MRKTELRRKSGIARKTRVRPVNAKRKAKNHARAYGGAERIAFVKSLPCIVTMPSAKHYGEIQVAHTKTGGIGRKADSKHTVPLCEYHHANQHTFGVESFQLAYGVDLDAEADRVETAWQTRKSS